MRDIVNYPWAHVNNELQIMSCGKLHLNSMNRVQCANVQITFLFIWPFSHMKCAGQLHNCKQGIRIILPKHKIKVLLYSL